MKKEEDFLRLEGKERVNINFENLCVRKRRRNPFFLIVFIFLVTVLTLVFIKLKSDEKNEESVVAYKEESEEQWQGAFISEDIFLKCRQASVSVIADGKICSGFVFSSDGWIASTNSIVNDAVKGKVKVVLCDGSVYEVGAFKESRRAGLVLMKIDAEELVPVDLSFEGKVFEGQDIYTFCSLDAKGEPSLFSGKISHTQRAVTVKSENERNKSLSLMQVSLLLTEEGAGVPLFDDKGRIVGIGYGGAQEGKYMINYAFLIKKTKKLLQKMRDGGYFDDDLYGFVLE